ncbi:MAG: FoF1 ATP synthase subunit a [Minisyncoccia bacterium]
MFRLSRGIGGVHPDKIIDFGSFYLVNTTLLSILILLIFVAVSVSSYKRYKIKPGKFQVTAEVAVESMLDLLTQITGNVNMATKILPVVGSMFVYIAVSNLIGLIPGLTSVLYNGATVFRGPTTDFNTTFGLAFGSILFLQFISIRDFGVLGYLGKFFKFKEIYLGFRQSLGEGFMAIVDFFIGLLDIVGELAKVVSLSLRLFGNMYAGDVLATLILGAFAYVLPITWSAMSLLSGVVQSIVFGSLITSYYMLSVKEEGSA